MKSKSASNTMKTQLRITRPNNNDHLNDAAGFRGFLLGNIRRKAALLASVATGVLCVAQTSLAHPPQGIGAYLRDCDGEPQLHATAYAD